MTTPYEAFVNGELPYRLSSSELEPPAGSVPVTKGAGLQMEFRDLMEYSIEDLHKLVVVATDCVEEINRSHLIVGTSLGAVTYPSTAAGMPDATGVWKFVGTGAGQGQFTVRGNSGSNKSLKLSSEPLVAVARFTWGSIMNKPYVCLSLQTGSMFGDVFYGVDTTAGCHIVLHAQDGMVYFVTKSGGVATGTIGSMAAPSPDTSITFCIVATDTAVKYYVDGVLQFTHTANIPTVDLVASFGSLDHSAAAFMGHTTNVDLLQFFRLYKGTPRALGIPSIT